MTIYKWLQLKVEVIDLMHKYICTAAWWRDYSSWCYRAAQAIELWLFLNIYSLNAPLNGSTKS